MGTLNLGILAHVDAGKTTLTERLLHAAGAIPEIGNVDDGTTQTDSLALERERGITIRSAVASFTIGDLAVNLIDTPGHPDFIAEVERVLGVLDGAILVVSAVEGVQSQTPLLMRALQRLRVPTLIFVGKLDRAGADVDAVLGEISRRLTPSAIPMCRVRGAGTASAEVELAGFDDAPFRATLAEELAENDDRLLAAYLDDPDAISSDVLRRAIVRQAQRAQVHPLFVGSARTGAGIGELMGGLVELLPTAPADADAPVSGRVFKIERTDSGARVAYARLFAGSLQVRDRVPIANGEDRLITAIEVHEPGGAQRRSAVRAGGIARLHGLETVRVGDLIGRAASQSHEHQFAPPTLESVVVARDASQRGALLAALAELADHDPLINVRQDDGRGEISVSLYGEVQKEVIGATLERDHGIAVDFRETTTLCIERAAGTGEAVELLHAVTKSNVTGPSSATSTNPFEATIGLRVGPAPAGSGIAFGLEVDVRLVPIYVFRTVDGFVEHMRGNVRDALAEGLRGWPVTDLTVTMFVCGYRAPGSSPADFRRLTPLVLFKALERAGTTVCEPVAGVRLELPIDCASRALSALGRLGARVTGSETRRGLGIIEALVRVARLPELQRALPGLTGGEGVLESRFAGYEPVAGGVTPVRPRSRPNPLDREAYVAAVGRRA